MKIMKKIMMMAMMMVASATAFAGDSDGLKAIMKSKTYDEANQLLKQNLASLADNAEKAKAYNKLVDLAMEKYNAESSIVTENQVNKQMGKELKPVDTKGMYNAFINALEASDECEKYDQLPNAKGKVAPKFNEKNKERLWNQRFNLVNAGQEAGQAEDHATMLKYWEAFLASDKNPIFKDCDRTQQNGFIGQIAYLTGFYNYQAKQYAKAMDYAELAMKYPGEFKEQAFRLKLELLKANLKTRQDSLEYVKKIREIYNEHPNNDALLENMYNILSAIGEKAEANKVLDDVLAKDPNNFVALADKGIAAMGEEKADEAITWLTKAVNVKPDNAIVTTYLGICLCVKAQNLDDKNPQKKELYGQAVKTFDKAKELDPKKETSNWGYNRFNAYYNYYGPNAPETKQAEADYKN
jgi:tetratricopeptide (TPR) repeat protein